MKIEKKNLAPTIVLGAICLVVALLLASVNLITRDVIVENDRVALMESLSGALPGEYGDEMTISDEMTAAAAAASSQKIEITHVYPELSGKGYVVTLLNKSGYTGKPIAITVGVKADGTIGRIIITDNPETKITKEISAYPAAFEGKSAEEIPAVDVVAGVTFSSKALRDSAAVALAVVRAIEA